jgi:hypothetical protein
MKEVKLEIEELEEKIAPATLIFADGPGDGIGPPDVTVFEA